MKMLLFLQGWYIVTYGLGIYHLNLFIAFLSPKIDPAMDFDGKHFVRSTSKYFSIQCFTNYILLLEKNLHGNIYNKKCDLIKN